VAGAATRKDSIVSSSDLLVLLIGLAIVGCVFTCVAANSLWPAAITVLVAVKLVAIAQALEG
jgi:hypothetical protein